MPRKHRDFEQQACHKYGVLVPSFCLEVHYLKIESLPLKYVATPFWWVKFPCRGG